MKNAYLIMVHDQENLFKKLLELLDDETNDIFLHVDKKMNFDETIELKNAKLYIIEPRSVNWGGYSQIQLEIDLLKKATEVGYYDYYHLLSGHDLPIKSNAYINEFLEKNKGKEFIDFYEEDMDAKILNRVKLYHFFQEKRSDKNRIKKIFYTILEKISLVCQQIIKVDRTKKNSHITLKKGANWFSITDALARYVVRNELNIKNIYHHTVCCDEMFLQTLVENSEFKNHVSEKGYLRYISWREVKHPYVWRIEDFEELMNNDCLFARKFDENIDTQIIDKIYNKVKS